MPKQSRLLRFLLSICVSCVAFALHAETITTKVDWIEAKSDGTRFLIREPGLNLYASGHYRDVLLQGYFRKATFSIGYQLFPCPGGMNGKCGTVYSVAVEQTNF